MDHAAFRKIIASGDTKRAIGFLETNLKTTHPDIVHLIGRFHKLKRDVQKGMLSYEEETRITNKINDTLLSYLSEGFFDQVLGQQTDLKSYLKLNSDGFQRSNLHIHTDHEIKLLDVFIQPRIKTKDTLFEDKESFLKYFEEWLKDEDDLRHLVILGGGGSGKSTYLKFLNYHLSANFDRFKFIPILINLHELIEYSDLNLVDFVRQYISTRTKLDYEAFRTFAENGRVVFLLDAFDELLPRYNFKRADHFFQDLRKTISSFPGNKVIVSGRFSFFKSEQDRFNILKSSPHKLVTNRLKPYFEEIHFLDLSNKQIHNFCRSFFQSDEEAESSYEWIIQNSEILKLSRQPFYLIIICSCIFKLRENEEFDDKGHEYKILETYVEEWLDWQISKETCPLLPAHSEQECKEIYIEIFSDIALKMYQSSKLKNEELKNRKYIPFSNQEEVRITVEESLKRAGITEKSLVNLVFLDVIKSYFIDLSSGSCRFFHYTILEFFVSRVIVKSVQEKRHKRPIFANVEWTNSVIEMSKLPVMTELQQANSPKLLRVKYSELMSKGRLGLFWLIGVITTNLSKLLVNIFEHPLLYIAGLIAIGIISQKAIAYFIAGLLLLASLYMFTKKQQIHNLIFRFVVKEKRNDYSFNVKALRFAFQTGELSAMKNRFIFERLFVTYTLFDEIKDYVFNKICILKHNLLDIYFKSVSFDRGNFFVGNIYDCSFVDTTFDGMEFSLVSFESCRFDNCDFSNIKFSYLSAMQLSAIRWVLRFLRFTANSKIPQYYALDFSNCAPEDFDSDTLLSILNLENRKKRIKKFMVFNKETLLRLDELRKNRN